MAVVEKFLTESADASKRLDHFLQDKLPAFSRSRVQDWIRAGRVQVDGRAIVKASAQLHGGERVEVEPAELAPLRAFAEDIPIHILYEDAAVIAVDKAAGMVVHLGAGNHEGTLVNALLHRFGTLSPGTGDERPGIVHRLDRDTSGVLLVARTDAAHRALAAQFAARTVEKTYLALVHGRVAKEHGTFEQPIERDSLRRTRMTARTGRGRTALTEYRVRERFAKFTFVEVTLHTGRTHQIRVHFSTAGHPIAADKLYGAPGGEAGLGLARFFLHAHRITFTTPASGDSAQRVTVESPLPADLQTALGQVRQSK